MPSGTVFFPILLPVGHDRQIARFPYFALGVVGVCGLVQLWATMAWWHSAQHAVLDPVSLGGYQPIRGLHPNLLFNIFVHGGWLHLAGNMLFLYVTAFNLEDRWGWQVFAPFYLATGVVATMTFGAFHPMSDVPLVGASGAVAGAMGAFLVCFFNARMRIWYFWWVLPPIPRFLYTGTFMARAYVVFPLWFAMELLFMVGEGSSLVAHSAHVGGFVFGLLFAGLMMAFGWDQRLVALAEESTELWSEDPDYLTALDHLDHGRFDEARSLLDQLVQRDPDHLEGRIALAQVLARSGEAFAAATHGSTAIDQLSRTDAARAADLFGELTEAAPSIPLSDSALAHVVHSALSERDVVRTFDAARRLLLAHPHSPQVPSVMLSAGQLQAQHGRWDLGRHTLENLIEVFPADPAAAQARKHLTQLSRNPSAFNSQASAIRSGGRADGG